MAPSLAENGKPHIFLLDEPAREKKHIISYTNSLTAQKEYAEIIDVMYEIVINRELSEKSLLVLKHAMESRSKQVWEEAGRRLVQLSYYFQQVETTLFDLLNHKHAKVRLRLIQSLWKNQPTEIVTKALLKQGLKDRSKKVRCFSADRVSLFCYTDVLPTLEALAKTETEEDVLKSLELAISSLKNCGK